MLHKTRGIVFKSTDYSESSVIVQVFTEKFGMQSYLINGVKKPRAKISKNILQPLHLLEMVVYHKPAASIQRVSEARQSPAFQTIPYDTAKSTVALFITEVLYKAIRQQTAEEQLFDFLFHSIEFLDTMEHGVALFHISFLLHLTRYLGFYPAISSNAGLYFDLKEGDFTNKLPSHPAVIHPPDTLNWLSLLKCNFEDLKNLSIPPLERKALLERVISYYQLHIEGFQEIKSYRILQEILS